MAPPPLASFALCATPKPAPTPEQAAERSYWSLATRAERLAIGRAWAAAHLRVGARVRLRGERDYTVYAVRAIGERFVMLEARAPSAARRRVALDGHVPARYRLSVLE